MDNLHGMLVAIRTMYYWDEDENNVDLYGSNIFEKIRYKSIHKIERDMKFLMHAVAIICYVTKMLLKDKVH